ncbi:MAG: hypothetical protein HQM04_05660 [Magnetococcales bacterium]|nr:hypothetical protein [Magnetococcales bacterium]MBF0114511.1 hypothetical protein [Magnetococcales bacterium]
MSQTEQDRPPMPAGPGMGAGAYPSDPAAARKEDAHPYYGTPCPHCSQGQGYAPPQQATWGYPAPHWPGWQAPPHAWGYPPHWGDPAAGGYPPPPQHPHHFQAPHPGAMPGAYPGAVPPSPAKAGGGLSDLLKSPLSALGDLLDLDDREFWKGALVGVAAVLLLGGQGGSQEESAGNDQHNKPE